MKFERHSMQTPAGGDACAGVAEAAKPAIDRTNQQHPAMRASMIPTSFPSGL